MHSSDELFQRSREGYFGVYFPSVETVRHESTYIILFLTRHNESINEDKNTIFTRRLRVSLARLSFC